MNNQKINVRRLALAAIFIALTAVMTMVAFAIPGGHGYIHLGDSMIYACAWAIGGPLAGIASALGSALADLFLAPQYMVATLVIKFIMGYSAYLIMKSFKYKMGTNILAMTVCSIVMVVAYTGYEYYLVGIGGVVPALTFNLIQAVGGVVTGTVLITILDKIKALDPLIAWKADKKDEQN